MSGQEESLIQQFVDSERFLYIYDSEFPYLLQSGLIFTAANPTNKSLPSTPHKVFCLAPKFYRGKATKSQCSVPVSNFGPYCREHCIMYLNLDVRPSNINPSMRGLFACMSTLNVHEIRHCRTSTLPANQERKKDIPLLKNLDQSEIDEIRNKRKPLFYAHDVIGFFGGVFFKKPPVSLDSGSMDPLHPSSYVLSFYCDNQEVIVDGFIESSGVARFSNSIIKTKTKTIGLEHLNSTLGIVNMGKTIMKLGDVCVTAMPCLIAARDIFDGEEIITDYDTEYWTDEMIKQLPKKMQDYLAGMSDEEPLFFQAK